MRRTAPLLLLLLCAIPVGAQEASPTFQWRIEAGDRFDLSFTYKIRDDAKWLEAVGGPPTKTKRWWHEDIVVKAQVESQAAFRGSGRLPLVLTDVRWTRSTEQYEIEVKRSSGEPATVSKEVVEKGRTAFRDTMAAEAAAAMLAAANSNYALVAEPGKLSISAALDGPGANSGTSLFRNCYLHSPIPGERVASPVGSWKATVVPGWLRGLVVRGLRGELTFSSKLEGSKLVVRGTASEETKTDTGQEKREGNYKITHKWTFQDGALLSSQRTAKASSKHQTSIQKISGKVTVSSSLSLARR